MPMPGNRIVFDKEENLSMVLRYLIRLAYRSRSILKLLECRGGSEGSTEDHYSIRALARYTDQRICTLVSAHSKN